jgi:trigger factor
MKSELVELSPVSKELKIEIEADLVAASHRRISNDYARYATLPGFRQGRAPVSLVQRRFKDEIASEVIRDLVPKAVEQAIKEHNLQPLGEPDVHLDNFDGLKELGLATITLHCHVEVMPQVEVTDYKGLEVTRRVRPFTDEDLDMAIESLREEGETMEPVEDRGAQDGDTVTAELKAHFVNGDDDDFDIEEMKLVLGDSNNLPEFDAALQGAQVDDVRACTVKYPAVFPTKTLQNKEVEYKLTINGLHLRHLPEADDDWAQSLGEGFASLDDMKEKLRERAMESSGKEADERLRNDIFNALIDKHDFEVPRVLVELQIDRLLEDTAQRLAYIGFDPRQLQKEFWLNYRENMRPQGLRDVKGMLLVGRIAEIEGIEASAEDIEAYFQETAQAVKIGVEEVRDALTKDGGESSIAASLRNRKVIEFLVANAKVTEGEWVPPGPPPVAQEDDPETGVAEEKAAEAATSEG